MKFFLVVHAITYHLIVQNKNLIFYLFSFKNSFLPQASSLLSSQCLTLPRNLISPWLCAFPPNNVHVESLLTFHIYVSVKNDASTSLPCSGNLLVLHRGILGVHAAEKSPFSHCKPSLSIHSDDKIKEQWKWKWESQTWSITEHLPFLCGIWVTLSWLRLQHPLTPCTPRC